MRFQQDRCGYLPARLVGAVFLLSSVPAVAAGPTLINGDFERDQGYFQVPTGWVPFGEAKFDATHNGDWKAQIVDVFAGHEAGLYQVVPDARPGRYRLTASVRSASSQLPVRVGLLPATGHLPLDVAWSRSHNENRWAAAQVEIVTACQGLVVLLQVRNENPEHQLLQGGLWDNVALEALSPAGSDAHGQHGEPALQRVAEPATQPALSATHVSANDVYGSLADLWSLAWPKPGVRTFLASSHDPNPRGNTDFDRVEGSVLLDGHSWSVLKSLDGPGAILRIWMTNFEKAGRICVEIDGRQVINERIVDFFGSPGMATWPLANRTSGAWMSYLPMPFARSARVLLKDALKPSFYWQITSQTFDSAEGVRPFSLPLNEIDVTHLRKIRQQWILATMNPKPPRPDTQTATVTLDLRPGETKPLFSQQSPGMVDGLWIDVAGASGETLKGLRITASWDDAPAPQVDAPLNLFFGAGYGRPIVRGLLVGMAPPDGGYCYFPMPFRAARIQLANTGTDVAERIRFRLQWVPLAVRELSPLRFCTAFRHEPEAGNGKLFVPLDVAGAGHFVGLSTAMVHGSVKDLHFLEGDEYFWVDGEAHPSIAGTGTEDYFTCGWYFFNGPITLAPVGAPWLDRAPLNRVACYRLHVPDWVPFDRSLKFALEVGDSITPEQADYASVAYYYHHVP